MKNVEGKKCRQEVKWKESENAIDSRASCANLPTISKYKKWSVWKWSDKNLSRDNSYYAKRCLLFQRGHFCSPKNCLTEQFQLSSYQI